MAIDSLWWLEHLWTVFVLIGGWFLKTLWEAMRALRQDLHDLERELPRNYVSKVDLQPILIRLEATLDRIETRLDTKVDKP